MFISQRLVILLLLSFSVQHLAGQNITSWVPSSAGLSATPFCFESTAHLPKGAEIRIQVVSIGNWQGEVAIYPDLRGHTVGPVARWHGVTNGLVRIYRILHYPGNRFLIMAGIPNPYLRSDSCTRHGDYDQLTFDRGWVLNVKVLQSEAF
jgi:hypothetical protein